MELTIESLLNKSIAYSPIFLNYGYYPTIPADLLCGNEITSSEAIGQFFKRMKSTWDASYKNMKKAVTL